MISEELREEIRKIIREEVESLIFIKREFHLPIRTYMQSLLYGELQNYKKFMAGCRPDNGTIYVVNRRKLTNISFYVDESIDLYPYYDRLIKEEKINCSFETFESVLTHKSQGDEKIAWTHKILRSKGINQQSIFDLLFSLDERILSFESYKRKRLINFVCRSFSKNGFDFNEDNIDNSFSKWRRKKIEKF